MTRIYNIPLEINSNWFLKIHLGKQCCIIYRVVMGILEGISAKSIINLSRNYSLALKGLGQRIWNYFFMSFHARWLWSCLQDSRALVGNLRFLKTVTLARNIFSTSLTKENRQSFVSGLQFFLSKTWYKSKWQVFPFEFHCYFENAFHVKKPCLFLLGVAQTSLLKSDSLYTTKSWIITNRDSEMCFSELLWIPTFIYESIHLKRFKIGYDRL